MNRYALYNQDLKMSYGPFKAVCRNHYVSTKKLDISIIDLGFLNDISVVDRNGSVLLTNARVMKVEQVKEKGKSIRTHVHIYGGES